MKNFIVSSKVFFDKYGNLNAHYDLDVLSFLSRLNLNIIPHLAPKKNLLKNVKKADGLILLGGGDIYKIDKTKENKIRDKIEKKLFKLFYKSDKPILAICRGFQLISDIYKIKLHKMKGHVRKNHNLVIKNSKFIYYKKLKVNSFHEYCVKKVPKNFKIISKLSDETIEIAEHKNKKILCLMFHPERKMDSKKNISKSIKNFIQ